MGEAVRSLEGRAYDATAAYDKTQRRPGVVPPHEALALRRERGAAIALADDVALLLCWLRQDVLSLAGPSLWHRRELFDFVLVELRKRRHLRERRLRPVCALLASQRDDLLGFCARLDEEVADLAAYAKVSEAVVREMVAVQEMADGDRRKWRRDAAPRGHLGGRYHELGLPVEALREGVVRASSVVENLNSRLRNYLFLRKGVGGGYLDLLRFFLNHRRFVRGARACRVGKSTAELLNGEAHAHWLELLGYERFRQTQSA